MISEKFLKRKTPREEYIVIENDFFKFRYFQNTTNNDLFKKLNLNLVKMIFDFMKFEDNKYLMVNLKNKKLVDVNKAVYKE
jgi:hypothetical protein